MCQHRCEGAGRTADGAVRVLLLGRYHPGGEADLPVVLMPLLHLVVQQQLEHSVLPHLLLWERCHHAGETDAHSEIQVSTRKKKLKSCSISVKAISELLFLLKLKGFFHA